MEVFIVVYGLLTLGFTIKSLEIEPLKQGKFFPTLLGFLGAWCLSIVACPVAFGTWLRCQTEEENRKFEESVSQPIKD